VTLPPTSVPVTRDLPPAQLPPPRRKRRVLVWALLVILLGAILWTVTSDSTGALQMQEFLGLKQDRPILDSSFSVGPHTFRYYKFALPEGSVNVIAIGHFKSAADSQSTGSPKTQSGDEAKDADVDNTIQVFVLTESAFAAWLNGRAASSLYESAKVADGTVQADIPPGAGTYYLVFSNKASPKTPKAVHASVLLRYKSWWRRAFTRDSNTKARREEQPDPRSGRRKPVGSIGAHFRCLPVWPNMLDGRSKPTALSRSANLGLIPVELKVPSTRPSDETPCSSNTNRSCMLTTSASIPVISAI